MADSVFELCRGRVEHLYRLTKLPMWLAQGYGNCLAPHGLDIDYDDAEEPQHRRQRWQAQRK